MSGDPEQEYFADGIAEDVITDLSKVSGLFVIARNSAFTYKGKAVNLIDAVEHRAVGIGAGGHDRCSVPASRRATAS
jgi:adenylate cyclase